jgi:hypothetical protein
MWRKKTGFNDFLAIVRRMDFLTRGRTYRSYYRWNPVTKSWSYSYDSRLEVEQVNDEYLMKYAKEIEHLSEEYKISSLNAWVRQRNGNATREFRNTRIIYEYEKRLKEYEAS